MKKIKKAIIPVGGSATRMFPISLAYPKEFLPIIKKDGTIRPAILCLIEDVYDAGIRDITLIVTKESQERFYEQFLNFNVDDSYLGKISDNNLEYVNKMRNMFKCVHLYFNSQIHGLGHVLYHCKNIVSNEPFLFLLGDQIYKTYTSENCVLQMLKKYDSGILLSACKTPLKDVNKYGIMHGNEIIDNCFEIVSIMEKPSIEYAKRNLRTNNNYYSVFGIYILDNQILNDAVHFFDSRKKLLPEYDLTTFISNYSGKKMTYILEGQYYDVGNVSSYNETFLKFQK